MQRAINHLRESSSHSANTSAPLGRLYRWAERQRRSAAVGGVRASSGSLGCARAPSAAARGARDAIHPRGPRAHLVGPRRARTRPKREASAQVSFGAGDRPTDRPTDYLGSTSPNTLFLKLEEFSAERRNFVAFNFKPAANF